MSNKITTSFYSEEELQQIGFKSLGSGVLLSRKASIYSAEKISIGDNVRIDDFCILSGDITLGSNIHISAYCALYGSKGIILEDYSGMSARATIYSAMDDFSGDFLIGPIHDEKYTNVHGGLVRIEKFCQLGVNSIVFPAVTIHEGSVIGAMSLVKKDLEPLGVYAGIPCRRIKERNSGLLKLDFNKK